MKQDEPMTDKPTEPIIYHRDAVLTVEQVAAALGVSVSTVERAHLPTIHLGERTKRYLWGQVLDTLAKKAA